MPRVAVIGLLACMLVAACTGSPTQEATDRRTSTRAASEAPAPSPDPSPSPKETASPTPAAGEETGRAPVNPVSLPALFEDEKYDGGGLRVGQMLAQTDTYTKYFVSYRSDGLRISGILDVPRGKGPFPALVLAHGYIDPEIYVNGQGLMREQDWLARAGYVVLHTDYRNHAASSNDPGSERRMRLGYTVDTINAVHALRAAGRVPVDRERIGLLGRSMGGGVVYNVLATQPGLVDAAVAYAPVSSRTADNFNRWIRDDPGRDALSDFILRTYGEPRDNPRFWREVSPRTYFDRITEPLLIHHGTADESCPIRWSRTSQRLLEQAGVDSRLLVYPGEPHAFIADWPLSMRRTVDFFRANL